MKWNEIDRESQLKPSQREAETERGLGAFTGRFWVLTGFCFVTHRVYDVFSLCVWSWARRAARGSFTDTETWESSRVTWGQRIKRFSYSREDAHASQHRCPETQHVPTLQPKPCPTVLAAPPPDTETGSEPTAWRYHTHTGSKHVY